MQGLVPRLTLGSAPSDAYRVLSVHGRETLSDGYRIVVAAVSAEPDDLSAKLGSSVSLAIEIDGEPVRWFHGLLEAATVSAERPNVFLCRIEILLKPPLLVRAFISRFQI